MNYLLLGIGLLILVKGADFMVDSASKLAMRMKIPAFVVGLFIVAIGTSAPEAAIGIFSGIEGDNLITLGDVVGSSILNVALVIGLTAMVFPLVVDSEVPKREMPFAILVQLVLLLFLFTGSELSRMESGLLLAGMVLFMAYVALKAKGMLGNRKPKDSYEKEVYDFIGSEEGMVEVLQDEKEKEEPLAKLIVLLFLGLSGLILGANLAVGNAVEIAHELGLSEAFIGLTIVAFGTSLPELVTCLVAAYRKEADLIVGNIIGSNIFNVLFVLGISGMIHPMAIGWEIYFDLLFMVFVSLMLFLPTRLFGKISKRTGFLLLAAYVLFLMFKLNGLS